MSTNSPTEGVALLYNMHSVAAVVLDNRGRERAGFDVEPKANSPKCFRNAAVLELFRRHLSQR